ncbi:MFS transporter [Herbiconiux liukaitaii]|uniref:MFS transporter n=1 Tax=Herbiconiux liukaitaii TaxID=3342799 RepID=UPI0035B950DD
MKRSFSLSPPSALPSSPRSSLPLIVASAGLIAAAYGLVRFGYGLLLPEMRSELGFDAVTAGAVAAGASVAYCVGAIIGFLAASRAARLLVLGAGAFAGLGAAGVAVAGEFVPFAVGAVVSSVGAGLASPALVGIVKRSVSSDLDERAQTIVNSGTGPGLIAAGVLALALLPNWRAVWVVAAVIALLTAGSVALLDCGESEGDGGRSRPTAPSVAWLVAHRSAILSALLLGAGSAAVWNFGRTLLVEEGRTDAESVVAWIAIGAGGSAAILTARWAGSRSARTVWTITSVGAATGTVGLALGAASTPLALLACALFGWGYTAGSGALIAWTSTIDARRAATGTAMLFVVLIVGQAVGGVLVGALIESSGPLPAFLVAAVVTAAAGITFGATPVVPAAPGAVSCGARRQLR